MNLIEHGFPLSSEEIKKLAYNNAEANSLKAFSAKSETAGHYWLAGFVKQHPNLSLKKAEDLSIGRASELLPYDQPSSTTTPPLQPYLESINQFSLCFNVKKQSL